MKVLVTGGTGFLGGWIVRELLAAGHTVRALCRAKARLDNLEGLAFERAEGDVTDRASVEKALEDRACEGLIHAAGIAHFASDEALVFAVNVGGAEIVFAAARAAGVKRAVITSSTAAMGGTLDPIVRDETAPSLAEGSGLTYFITKWRGEQAALAAAQPGFAVCATRPVVALGPGDIYNSSTGTIVALAKHGIPAIVRGGASFCDARELAKAHVAALERGRSGEAYILGGHNLEIAEMARRVAAITGVPAPRKAPYALAYLGAAVMEFSARALGRPVGVSRDLLRASRLYTWVSSAKAEKELGYTLRPFDDSLRDTLRFHLASGRLRATTPELRALAARP